MALPLRYKLGGVTLTPASANGTEILYIGDGSYAKLNDFEGVRMRDFPISRAIGDEPVYIRFAVSGRLLHNVPWPPEVQIRVMEGSRRIAWLLSDPSRPSWPESVCRNHGVVQEVVKYVPPSDDPGHGTGDARLHIEYAIRWHPAYPRTPLPFPDPCGGPLIDDPRAFEWSGLQLEFFTW